MKDIPLAPFEGGIRRDSLKNSSFEGGTTISSFFEGSAATSSPFEGGAVKNSPFEGG
jgi:hypothetical protein